MATHVAIGASVAAFVAAIWVVVYLTTVGSRYLGYSGSLLIDFVTGSATGSDLFSSTEPLFVAVTRFLLAFGLLWMPLALVSKVIALIAGI